VFSVTYGTSSLELMQIFSNFGMGLPAQFLPKSKSRSGLRHLAAQIRVASSFGACTIKRLPAWCGLLS